MIRLTDAATLVRNVRSAPTYGAFSVTGDDVLAILPPWPTDAIILAESDFEEVQQHAVECACGMFAIQVVGPGTSESDWTTLDHNEWPVAVFACFACGATGLFVIEPTPCDTCGRN